MLVIALISPWTWSRAGGDEVDDTSEKSQEGIGASPRNMLIFSLQCAPLVLLDNVPIFPHPDCSVYISHLYIRHPFLKILLEYELRFYSVKMSNWKQLNTAVGKKREFSRY